MRQDVLAEQFVDEIFLASPACAIDDFLKIVNHVTVEPNRDSRFAGILRNERAAPGFAEIVLGFHFLFSYSRHCRRVALRAVIMRTLSPRTV
jgi:hypothetical protein